MTQLRYLFIAMCGWFFLLYNIERLVAPINMASFVYVFAPACTILLLLSLRLCQLPLQWLFALVLPIYFLLKVFFQYEIGGASLPLTITELSAITVTTVLARMIGLQFEEWRKIITSLTLGELRDDLQPFETGQAQIYREIRRARRHQRAAALLAVTAIDISGDSISKRLQSTPLYRFLEEVRRETLEKYVSARLAEFLVAELGDLAIVTKRNGHFVTLLPETDRSTLQDVVRRLQLAAKEKLGLQLKIGISTFPDEAVTFERMLEDAETEMIGAKHPISTKVEKNVPEAAANVTFEAASTQIK
jgi:hypothetical protein